MNDIYKPVFRTRIFAENVISKIKNMIDCYGEMSVADYYDIIEDLATPIRGTYYDCNIPRQIYTDSLYGWRDYKDIKIINTNDGGYKISLPDYVCLEDHIKENVSCKSSYDEVSHPEHYQSEMGLETIDVIKAFTFDLKGIEACDTGNALKYLCRWSKKNGIQDLKKAKWYIEHLINHLEVLEKENENYEK